VFTAPVAMATGTVPRRQNSAPSNKLLAAIPHSSRFSEEKGYPLTRINWGQGK